MTSTPQQLAELALHRGERHEVSIDGHITSYWRYPAAHPNAPKAVLVHGYRGNHHGLEAIAGALPSHELFIPDLPGFGDSEPLSVKHTVETYSSWLIKFVDLVAPNSTFILGHSFGSIVVSAAAAAGLKNPLILVNPVSNFKDNGLRAMLEGTVRLYYWVGGVLPERAGTAALKAPAMVRAMSEVLTKTRNPSLRGWIHKQHAANFSAFSNRRVATEGYLASIGKGVASFARNITQPVLLILGELDDITNLKDQLRTKTLFRNVSSAQISGVGHLIHYEAPILAAQHILDFDARNQQD
ncbi:MAG: alpha/beta fold hydrolase [Micrococcales bacterium]